MNKTGKRNKNYLPITYATRMKFLQEKFKYRTDVCANFHYKIYINCESSKPPICTKKTRYMEGTQICPSGHRFTIVSLTISSTIEGKETHHANSVIIDHDKKEYERFEPNGVLLEPRESIINETMNKEFRKQFSLDDYIYLNPASFCPLVNKIDKKIESKPSKPYDRKKVKVYGPQSHLKNASKGELGTCIFWSLYYIEQRMLYPEMSRYDFMMWLADKPADHLNTIIRNFVVKVHYAGYSLNEGLYQRILDLDENV